MAERVEQHDWASVAGLWPLGTGQGATARQPMTPKMMIPTTLISYSLLIGLTACQHKVGVTQIGSKVNVCVQVQIGMYLYIKYLVYI